MITLDIEDNSIKVMSVKGRQVETAASLPLEPGLVQDGVIIDKSTVSRRISELMAAQGIAERKVVVGINGVHALYRTFKIPKLPKNLMDEAIKREAERVMPVPLNEIYTSWQTFDLSSVETDVSFVGIPRNTVDAMMETLRQAGLQPEATDIRPLALARVTDERDAIVINVQQLGFDIVVMINGMPEVLRSLTFPAGATSPDAKIEEVKEELERTITYYNTSHREREITPTMATFVSGELGETLTPTLERRIKPLPQLLSYVSNLNASEYVANIGLALRQAHTDSPMQVSLNITPQAYLPKQLPVIQIASWVFLLLGLLVLILFGILTVQKYRDTQRLNTQVSSLLTQVEAGQGGQSTVKQLQAKIAEAKSSGAIFTETLQNAKIQRDEANDSLAKVTSLAPGIIGLRAIGYNNGIVTVTGSSPDETIVVEYVRTLRNSGQFSEVLISSMNEIEYNEWQFALRLQ